MEIFDSHAHYNDAAFAADRDAVLSALPEKGVVGVVNAADSLESIPACLDLAARYPFVYAAVGVHPEAAATVDAATLPEKLLPFLSEKKVVAIGEIGLDYHYEDACPREKQLAVFAAQLRFAVEKDLPVIVHDRDAHADTLQLLTRYRPRGVMHCFSGSVEMLRDHLQERNQAARSRGGSPCRPPARRDGRAVYGADAPPRRAVQLGDDRLCAGNDRGGARRVRRCPCRRDRAERAHPVSYFIKNVFASCGLF